MEKISINNIIFTCSIELSGIKELSMEVEINNHGKIFIKGIISKKRYEEACKMKLLGKSFKLSYMKDGEQIPLFIGLIQEVKMEREGGLYEIYINGYSQSIKFDDDKKIRFFQDKRLTYRNVLDKIAGTGRIIHSIAGKGQKIPYSLLQYEETDWEFLKRLAGLLHTVIVADVMSGYMQIAFGMPKGAVYNLLCPDKYTLRRFIDKVGNQSAKNMAEKRHCTVSWAEDIKLGDIVKFLNQSWVVCRKKMVLSNGLLEPEYELRDENSIGLPFIYHSGLQGLDLEGEVLETSEELIKIRTGFEDRSDTADLFSYVFLPETGNLLYSMPEPGAKVRLHFPMAMEEGCFIINSNRNHRVEYPVSEMKVMQTPEGKSIFMTPKRIALLALKRKRAVSICMEDTKGIDFTSAKTIRIRAGQNIKIKSGSSCMITSDSLISAEQRNTENRIEINGNCIKMSAEQYMYSTPMQKAMRSKEPQKIDFAACAALYGYAIGAIPNDVADDRDAAALAAIPIVCSADGMVTIADYIGWRSGKN